MMGRTVSTRSMGQSLETLLGPGAASKQEMGTCGEGYLAENEDEEGNEDEEASGQEEGPAPGLKLRHMLGNALSHVRHHNLSHTATCNSTHSALSSLFAPHHLSVSDCKVG